MASRNEKEATTLALKEMQSGAPSISAPGKDFSSVGLLATPVFLLLQVKITDFFLAARPQFACRWTRASKKSVQSSMNVPHKKKKSFKKGNSRKENAIY